jgi:hypothetical protein
VSLRRPVHERWCDAQGVSILDREHVEHIEVDRTANMPPLSTECIIAQLQQLLDLLPRTYGAAMTEIDGPQ